MRETGEVSREELRQRHGTPSEFRVAVLAAIGEISLTEAENAIRLYEREWAAAR